MNGSNDLKQTPKKKKRSRRHPRGDRFLVELKFKSAAYSVRATIHARERMEQRNVEEFVVIGNILALGEERLAELQATQEEAIITDERNNVAVVIGFDKNTLRVITVLNDTNIWNNRGTKMIKLRLENEEEL